MAARLQKTPLLVLPILLVVFVLVVTAYGLTSSAVASESDVALSGQLKIDGISYRFAPTTCTITEADFVAAGQGRIDDEVFWVSASADGVDLAVGPESEIEVPHEDQLWLSSVASVQWSATDGEIEANTLMRDEREARADTVPGSLTVSCDLA